MWAREDGQGRERGCRACGCTYPVESHLVDFFG